MRRILLPLIVATLVLSACTARMVNPPAPVTEINGQIPNWQGGTGASVILSSGFSIAAGSPAIFDPPAYRAPVAADGSFRVRLDTPADSTLNLQTLCPQLPLNGLLATNLYVTSTFPPVSINDVLGAVFFGVPTDMAFSSVLGWLYADRAAQYSGTCENFAGPIGVAFVINVESGWNHVKITLLDEANPAIRVESAPAPADARWFFSPLRFE